MVNQCIVVGGGHCLVCSWFIIHHAVHGGCGGRGATRREATSIARPRAPRESCEPMTA
jgi:hypothetical protein